MKSLHGAIALLLSCNLCLPAPLGLAQDAPSALNLPSAAPQAPLRGDTRILHALDRFTFGPRPGDLEAVRRMGLDAWFEQQLHPGSLDESALNARLADYPAMQWSTEQLIFRMPSNAIIRQAADGKIPIPATGTLQAVYANQIYRFQRRKEQQAQKEPASAVAAPPDSQQPAASTGAAPGNRTDAAPDPSSAHAVAGPAQVDATQVPVWQVLALAPDQRVLRLQSMPPDEFDAFMKSLRSPQRAALLAGLSPDLRESVEDLENPEQAVVQELFAQRLAHDIYANAQLQEVMTDFWLNHFNVYLRKNEQMPYYLVSYERDVIRPHALGRFEDLLEAVAHSPAMLLYLDNAESLGPDSFAAERARMNAGRNAKKNAPEGLNENYARELMELHTVGVNGGYTQADIIQVARVLTGWGVDRPQFGGGFQFNPNRHEPGAKLVLNTKIKENGEMEGVALLHLLATRPATAQFLSRELAIRFVSDNPQQALVDRMARTWLASGGDIPAVLKTLFHSPEFWSAGDYRAKVKTPLEFVVSAARAANADISNYQPLVNALRQMGMPLYGCVPPTGYKWDETAWVSTGALVDRMNFALALAANRFPGIVVDWAPAADLSSLDSDTPAAQVIPTPESEEARLEPLIVPGGISIATRSAALQLYARQIAASPAEAVQQPDVNRPNRTTRRAPIPDQYEREDQQIAGLLLGSPEFQRR